MNTCKLCGKPLTLTPEYDYCMECQGKIMRESTIPQNSFANNSTKISTGIYDEAIEQRNGIYRCYGSWNKSFQRDYDYERLILKALERAKKEHELLEWYRESWKSMRDGRLERKIEALEKELEEMK